VLDRNGLRPSRYVVTKDGFVVMASEVGVLDIAPDNVLHKDRLQPGRMFLVDTAQGRIIADEELKEGMAARHPYRHWLDMHLVRQADLPAPHGAPVEPDDDLLTRQQLFGYTLEDCASSWRRWRSTARRRSARWAPTPRWPCCRTSRSRCSTTSSSSSRR
jgi:hypothetical protein